MKHYIFLSALLVATLSCGEKKAETVETKEEAQAVTVTKATLGTIDNAYLYTATVEPYKRNAISPAQPNRIKRLYVEVGQKVNKGQLLAEMDETSVNQQKMQIANYEKDLGRTQELVAAGGASKQQLDQQTVQVQVAKESLKLMLENAKLESPIDGIVTARNYDEGDMSGQQPVYEIMQIRPAKVIINISEQLFDKIKQGMKVKITTDVYGEDRFDGKVSLIYPTIDMVSRTFKVEITLPNGDLRIRPGMFARVDLNLGEYKQIVVPDVSVVRQPGSDARYVFVVEGNVARYRSVTLGRRLGDKFEISSGLNEGETVVVNGNSRLVDGKEVVIK